MKKLLILLAYTLLPILCFSQVVKQGETFTGVPVVQGKVRFLKEIPLKKELTEEGNYNLLKDWSSANYGKNPFISSIRHDTKNNEFIAKSRAELLLPPNSKGVREKMTMRYRINGFLFQDKCILEITEISFMYENAQNSKQLSKFIRAEEFISDNAIKIKDEVTECRANTRKSTLQYINEIASDLEKKFGY